MMHKPIMSKGIACSKEASVIKSLYSQVKCSLKKGDFLRFFTAVKYSQDTQPLLLVKGRAMLVAMPDKEGE